MKFLLFMKIIFFLIGLAILVLLGFTGYKIYLGIRAALGI